MSDVEKIIQPPLPGATNYVATGSHGKTVKHEQDASARVFHWAVSIALLSMVLAVASSNMIVDLDLYHEMSLYRQMESEGAMPTKDAFAYTPTIDFVVHHEWATGAVMYLATVKTGLGSLGVVLIKYFLTFAVCIGCFLYARRHGASLAVFAILAPICLQVGGWMAFSNVRAQLFTLFFLVCMFALLAQDRQGKKWWIVAWVPLFIVWGNMHGGVVSGMGLFGLYCFTRLIEAWLETRAISQTFGKVSHLIVVGFGTIGLLYVNPYGTEYAPYLIRAVSMKRPAILEWLPLYEIKFPTMYCVSVLIAGYAIVMRGKQSIFESLAIILTAYLALKHYRHGSLYAVTWACFVPPMIQAAQTGKVINRAWDRLSPFVFVAAIGVTFASLSHSIQNEFWMLRVPNERSVSGARVPTFPVGAVDYLLDQKFSGNLMVPFTTGAYVSWRMYPDVKVSIDSRYEVAYPHGAIEEDGHFNAALPGWEKVLNKYHTDAVLIDNDVPLAEAMAVAIQSIGGDPPVVQWAQVYRDKGFSVYVPNRTATKFPVVDRSNENTDGLFP
ncbi:MAG: hypothetical protein AB8B55_15205 [Mariniblastus sp.]